MYTPVAPVRSREKGMSGAKSEATSGGAAARQGLEGRGQPGGGGKERPRPCQPQCHATDGPVTRGQVQIVAQGPGNERKGTEGVQG